jgi:DNA-3-methyladenine glycosylase I
MELSRCSWAKTELMQQYHDTEWGVPLHDDRTLFEFLTLEGAQAGLSWQTILQRREGYRRTFENFDPKTISEYDQDRIEALLTDPGIIRNRLKVQSTVTNARAFLKIQAEFGSFDQYIWRFVDGQPRINAWASSPQNPAHTEQSDAMSRDLQRRGFKFVGSTICYAFMQATGMVNDHPITCFRHVELLGAK